MISDSVSGSQPVNIRQFAQPDAPVEGRHHRRIAHARIQEHRQDLQEDQRIAHARREAQSFRSTLNRFTAST